MLGAFTFDMGSYILLGKKNSFFRVKKLMDNGWVTFRWAFSSHVIIVKNLGWPTCVHILILMVRPIKNFNGVNLSIEQLLYFLLPYVPQDSSILDQFWRCFLSSWWTILNHTKGGLNKSIKHVHISREVYQVEFCIYFMFFKPISVHK